MVQRCCNPKAPKWRFYGARGISLCERWRKFDNFVADMGERPGPQYTLDRIDTWSGYGPGNCRWTTYDVQRANRRDAHWITFNGVTRTVGQWACTIDVPYRTLRSRLYQMGWSIDRALSTPSGRQPR